MALVLADRVKETTTTTGTGTITLLGAVSGYQSFAAIGNANTTYYAIVGPTTEWEVGIGTYTSSGTLLSRDRTNRTCCRNSRERNRCGYANRANCPCCLNTREGDALNANRRDISCVTCGLNACQGN